jgi:hypothetical protein
VHELAVHQQLHDAARRERQQQRGPRPEQRRHVVRNRERRVRERQRLERGQVAVDDECAVRGEKRAEAVARVARLLGQHHRVPADLHSAGSTSSRDPRQRTLQRFLRLQHLPLEYTVSQCARGVPHEARKLERSSNKHAARVAQARCNNAAPRLHHALLGQQLKLVLHAARLELRVRIHIADVGHEREHEAALPGCEQHEAAASGFLLLGLDHVALRVVLRRLHRRIGSAAKVCEEVVHILTRPSLLFMQADDKTHAAPIHRGMES